MNQTPSLTTLCASLCEIMGIAPPKNADCENAEFVQAVKSNLGGTADRIVMFNPDAIGEWISKKYAELLAPVNERCNLSLAMKTVMPSVTPVCFGTMYTGAAPCVHGIQSYVKPVIQIESIFDALIKAGKKPAIVVTAGDSLSKIFLERPMDYFILPTIEEVNAKAMELLLADEHDFIVIYNGNYDTVMHKFGPESKEALSELSKNAKVFSALCDAIEQNWKSHNTLLGFAMDHGCHEIDGGCGSHGLDMEEDINIVHQYKTFKAK